MSYVDMKKFPSGCGQIHDNPYYKCDYQASNVTIYSKKITDAYNHESSPVVEIEIKNQLPFHVNEIELSHIYKVFHGDRRPSFLRISSNGAVDFSPAEPITYSKNSSFYKYRSGIRSVPHYILKKMKKINPEIELIHAKIFFKNEYMVIEHGSDELKNIAYSYFNYDNDFKLTFLKRTQKL